MCGLICAGRQGGCSMSASRIGGRVTASPRSPHGISTLARGACPIPASCGYDAERLQALQSSSEVRRERRHQQNQCLDGCERPQRSRTLDKRRRLVIVPDGRTPRSPRKREIVPISAETAVFRHGGSISSVTRRIVRGRGGSALMASSVMSWRGRVSHRAAS